MRQDHVVLVPVTGARRVREEGHRRDVMTGVPVTPCFLRIREFRAREAVLAVDCRVGVKECAVGGVPGEPGGRAGGDRRGPARSQRRCRDR